MIDVNKVLIYIQLSGRFLCVLLVLQRSDSCAKWSIETELAEFSQLEQTTTNSVPPLIPKVGYNILCITLLLPFLLLKILFPSLFHSSIILKEFFHNTFLNKNC